MLFILHNTMKALLNDLQNIKILLTSCQNRYNLGKQPNRQNIHCILAKVIPRVYINKIYTIN